MLVLPHSELDSSLTVIFVLRCCYLALVLVLPNGKLLESLAPPDMKAFFFPEEVITATSAAVNAGAGYHLQRKRQEKQGQHL